MAFSIVLGIASIGAICALLYNLAVYVLPVAVGLWTGFWAMDTGAGPFGGIVVGFAAGVVVFVLGQAIFTSSRSALVRLLVALIFAVPAAYAGYSIMLQVLGLGDMTGVWAQVFAIVSGAVTGGTTIARLAQPIEGPDAA
ncbi:MAG: hypothetical protein RIC85_02270 [Gammaproteobacteria bacterium]|uniref:hypothetical protein n=1 Tax=Thalassobaculum sp. TaxID=2022740 RepID=UPI0032EB324A